METIQIQYSFTLTDGSQEVFDIQLDAQELLLADMAREPLPPWTALDFHKCYICPLDADSHPHCPPSAHLASMVNRFGRVLSHDEVKVVVVTNERTVSQNTTAQRGISSLMGLVMATSGCPHSAFFKPMARFHLPLASEDETIYRATSMYLLAQYLLKKEGRAADVDMEGLAEIYSNMHVVNMAVAERLRVASETDSSVNAIILLDLFAKAMPYVIKDSLDEIRYLFTPFFRTNKG